MPEPILCHFCKTKLTEAEVYEFDDTIMCFHCLEELTTICECCMERIWRDEAEGGNTHTLCRYCYENNYTNCSECGRLIHNDDAHYTDDSDEPYCQDCYDKMFNESIHDYYYKPSPIFYGGEGDSLFMGVELEIDEAGEDSYNAQQIIDIANKQYLFKLYTKFSAVSPQECVPDRAFQTSLCNWFSCQCCFCACCLFFSAVKAFPWYFSSGTGASAFLTFFCRTHVNIT